MKDLPLKKLVVGIYLIAVIPAFLVWYFIGGAAGVVYYILTLPLGLFLGVPPYGIGDAFVTARSAGLGPLVNISMLYLLCERIEKKRRSMDKNDDSA